MTKKEWTIIGILGVAVVVVFSCFGCLMLSMLTSPSRPASPTAVAEIVIATTLEATATQTNTPRPISITTPRPTHTPESIKTLMPTATFTLMPTKTSKPVSTPTPISGQPVSQYYAPLNAQVKGGDAILTSRRIEFWQEVGTTKAKNGLFVVLIGELSSTTGKDDCPKADDFSLYVEGRKYSTSSSEMGRFQSIYRSDYPGSVRGQCVTKAEATYLVFDVPVQLGPSRLVFRGVPTELGDWGLALQKTQMPTPQPTTTATPPLAVFKIGETVSAGNWEYKVTKTEKTKTLVWSEFGNKTDAKGIFLIVYMTLKNIGTRNFTINTWDFELRDSSGIKYDTSSDFGAYAFTEYKKLATLLGDQFPPGVAVNTALIFDINPSAKGLTLYLEQARVSIDLGQ